MNWQVLIEAPAQAEIVAAFEWYEAKSYGLGGEFLRAVAAASEHLSRSPESFPASRQRFRRIVLRKFPYALHYEVLDGEVVSVLACLHHRRSPERWPGSD